jgi:hypothetical protein
VHTVHKSYSRSSHLIYTKPRISNDRSGGLSPSCTHPLAPHPQKLKTKTKKDPWWDPARDRLSNLLRLPRRTYKHLFHYSRPDTCHKICRNPEWQHLRSEWRYVHSLFVYIGRPTRILWKVRLPLVINMIVAIVLIINEEVRLPR